METIGTGKGPALTYINGDREPVRNGCNFAMRRDAYSLPHAAQRDRHVRFGQKADIEVHPCDVRLLPKADITECDGYVRFVPKADIPHCAKNDVIRSPRRPSAAAAPARRGSTLWRFSD